MWSGSEMVRIRTYQKEVCRMNAIRCLGLFALPDAIATVPKIEQLFIQIIFLQPSNFQRRMETYHRCASAFLDYFVQSQRVVQLKMYGEVSFTKTLLIVTNGSNNKSSRSQRIEKKRKFADYVCSNILCCLIRGRFSCLR